MFRLHWRQAPTSGCVTATKTSSNGAPFGHARLRWVSKLAARAAPPRRRWLRLTTPDPPLALFRPRAASRAFDPRRDLFAVFHGRLIARAEEPSAFNGLKGPDSRLARRAAAARTHGSGAEIGFHGRSPDWVVNARTEVAAKGASIGVREA